MLVYSVIFDESHVSRILKWKWLRQLGVIAYGVYLLHEGILDVGLRAASLALGAINALQYCLVTLICMTATFLLAYLSWANFEKLFVSFSHRYKYERL